MRRTNEAWIALFFASVCAACGGAEPAPKAPTEADPAPSSTPEPASGVTAEECEAAGGTVVGDIGDGAIHRPDYVCASGAKPTGPIRAKEGAPIAVEGSVCCPKAPK
jgi:hypothetical protein